jgi:RNA polymerase sigma-70 factor (ECF subfamily)
MIAEFPCAERPEAPDIEPALLERLRSGDVQALEAVMRRYNQRLFRVARSILRDGDLAEDAVQEAYIAAFYKLDRYSPTGSFAAWLTRIAVNEALMIKRNRSRHDARRDPAEVDEIDTTGRDDFPSGDPAAAVAGGELIRMIEKAVDRLPEDFRTVFVLRGVERLSVLETAEVLDINPATVKTRYYRARILLQRTLSRAMDHAELHAFEFAGERCDRIVANVVRRVTAAQGS